VGRVSVGYNWSPHVDVTGQPLIIGGEAFFQFGSNSTTIPGIPGTGSIAPPAAMANDSTTVQFGNQFGILGKIGMVLTPGGSPIFVAFDAGVGWQDVNLNFNCTAAGACGTNGIPPQTLGTSKTLNGSLIGGEFSLPLRNLPVLSNGAATLPFLNNATVGFQFVHGSFGFTQPMGSPTQIQITASQDVQTNSYMATFRLPIGVDRILWNPVP
jgi:hypothetical protein